LRKESNFDDGKEPGGGGAKHYDLICDLTVAHAEAYATEVRLRRPEASGTNCRDERTNAASGGSEKSTVAEISIGSDAKIED
jgi:hypothetical protein